MIISRLIKHIQTCINVAQSYTLSNEEERKLTLQLVDY